MTVSSGGIAHMYKQSSHVTSKTCHQLIATRTFHDREPPLSLAESPQGLARAQTYHTLYRPSLLSRHDILPI
jgi:hypothetical protein